MAWGFDDVQVGGQLQVGTGVPPAIGQGKTKINGSAHIEGPIVAGGPLEFVENEATLMVARTKNDDEDCTPADLSLKTKGNVVIEGDDGTADALVVEGDQTINNGNLHTSNLVAVTGQGCAWSGSTINVQGWKGFDIKHPTRDNHRLRYVCLEGPEAGVYFRGRVRNSDFTVDIPLPSYWKYLVDVDSITVQLQPIGYKQPNIIVKSWDEEKITLQSETGIDCFYHVHASRKDGEPLIPEYEGESPNDYPGNPDQFSIAGHDYGRGM